MNEPKIKIVDRPTVGKQYSIAYGTPGGINAWAGTGTYRGPAGRDYEDGVGRYVCEDGEDGFFTMEDVVGEICDEDPAACE
jgi:hypothetical protein